MKVKSLLLIIIVFIGSIGCKDQKINNAPFKKLEANSTADGNEFEIKLYKGKHSNHPTFAFWLEDLEGNYIETLFVTKYLGSGIYGHGSIGEGKWDSKPGEAKRPASLPYWLHKRGIKADGKTFLPTVDKPIADAITGATPTENFILKTKSTDELPEKFRLLMEINQPWDWNEYWNNGLYPDDADYKTSCQPALVYAVTIDQTNLDIDYYLNPIGHSHYSGENGNLYTDLTTISTAKEIVHKILVHVKK